MYSFVEWIENGKLHEAVLDDTQYMNLALSDNVRIITVKAL